MLLAVTIQSTICGAVLQETVLFSTVTKHEKWHHCMMPIKECEMLIKD